MGKKLYFIQFTQRKEKYYVVAYNIYDAIQGATNSINVLDREQLNDRPVQFVFSEEIDDINIMFFYIDTTK